MSFISLLWGKQKLRFFFQANSSKNFHETKVFFVVWTTVVFRKIAEQKSWRPWKFPRIVLSLKNIQARCWDSHGWSRPFLANPSCHQNWLVQEKAARLVRRPFGTITSQLQARKMLRPLWVQLWHYQLSGALDVVQVTQKWRRVEMTTLATALVIFTRFVSINNMLSFSEKARVYKNKNDKTTQEPMWSTKHVWNIWDIQVNVVGRCIYDSGVGTFHWNQKSLVRYCSRSMSRMSPFWSYICTTGKGP